MPRPCNACRHPELDAINRELAGGTPRLAVARQFGLSEPAVRRHFHLHLPASLQLATEADRQQAARELLGVLQETTAELRRLAERARDRRQGRAWLRAVRLLYPLLELRTRVLEVRRAGSS